MAAKRTTLPPELMPEWADTREVSEVYKDDQVSVWCKGQGGRNHTYTPRFGDWVRGASQMCRTCAAVVSAAKRRTECDEVNIKDLYHQGYSFSRISQTLRVSIKGVTRWAKSNGVSSHRKVRPIRQLPDWLFNQLVDKTKIPLTEESALWRHGCGYEWEATRKARQASGDTCPQCSNMKNFRRHPDFETFKSLVHCDTANLTTKSKIAVACIQCGKPRAMTLGAWFRHGEQRKSPNGTITRLNSRTCRVCSGLLHLPDRLRAEAPAIASTLPHLSAACDYMILWCLFGGKSPGMLRATRKGLLALQKGGDDAAFVDASIAAAEGQDSDAVEEPDELAEAEEGEADTTALAYSTPTTPQQLKDQTERLIRASAVIPPDAEQTTYTFLRNSIIAARWATYAAAESVERLGNQPSLSTADIVAEARQNSTHEAKLLKEAMTEWCRQYDGAASLKLGVMPRKNGRAIVPSMMQRLVAFLLSERPWLGNWSAPGAGKTLAALLAARVLGAKLTLIVCPLNVIPSWERAIGECYATCSRRGLAEKITWKPDNDSEFLIWNYDLLQAEGIDNKIADFCRDYGDRIGLVVVDECHRAKNDGTIGQSDESRRRAALRQLRQQLSSARWLVQSGTPVITGIDEGVSLLRLLANEADDVATKYELGNRTSIASALRMHAALVEHGVRFKPDYGCRVVEPHLRTDNNGTFIAAKGRRFAVDGALFAELTAEETAALSRLGRADWLGVDDLQLDAKLRAISDEIKPQTVIYTYSVGKRRNDAEIVDRVADYVRKRGFSVGVYDGRTESKKPSRLSAAELKRLQIDVRYGKPERRVVDLVRYKRREVDVLVCSATLGEGVDGLHEVGHRLIILAPPFTDGAYEQLVARWARQGQASPVVEVIMPIACWRRPDGLYGSIDMHRLEKIRHRRDVSRAALDGVIPESRGYSARALRERVVAELEALRRE